MAPTGRRLPTAALALAVAAAGCDAPPWFVEVRFPGHVAQGAGPSEVLAVVDDDRAVTTVEAQVQVDGGPPRVVSLEALGEGVWRAAIPGHGAGRRVDFYLAAQDTFGHVTFEPADAPRAQFSYRVVTPDAGCDDVECGPGEACDPASGTCVVAGVCPDALEPSHRDAPRRVAIDRPIVASLCGRDEDWYSVEVPAGLALDVAVDVLSRSGPGADVRVLRARDDVPEAQGIARPGAPLRLRAAQGPVEVWIVVVGERPADPPIAYTLTPITEPVGCQDDAWEENDAAGLAAALGVPEQRRATLCPGDEDWFRVTSQQGGVIRVGVHLDDPGRPFDVHLRQEGVGPLDHVAAAGGGAEVFTPAGARGTFLIGVSLADARGAVGYRLETSRRAALCDACTVDDDCGGPEDLCVQMRSGRHCASACRRDAECPAGFVCLDLAGRRQCVPDDRRCD